MKEEQTGGLEFRIRVISGSMKGKAFRLLGKSIVIGRGEGADIRINDNNMSRQHAKIEREGIEFTIYDLDSKNGILYKTKKVKKAVLTNQDVFQLGDTDFQFIEHSLNQPQEDFQPQPAMQPIQREIISDSPTGKSELQFGLSKDKIEDESKFSFFNKSKPKGMSFGGKSKENIRRVVLYSILIGAFGFSFAVKKGLINLNKNEQAGTSQNQAESNGQRNTNGENIGLTESDLKNLIRDDSTQGSNEALDVNKLYSKALLQYDLKRFNDAIALLDKILSIEPNHSQARIKKIEWIKGRDALGEKILKQAVHYYDNRYFKEAESQFKMVLQLIPEKTHYLHRQAEESLKSIESAPEH